MYIVNVYQPNITGQTDIHFSKEGVYPSWFGYAMREKAPFKEHIDKWDEFSNDELLSFACVIQCYTLSRVMRFSQFGLDNKWHEMAKIAYSDYKIAMRKSGNPVS